MRKIIRNLLVGFISFLPTEKARANSSTNAYNYGTEAKILLEKLERGESEKPSVGLYKDIEEALRLADEMMLEEQKNASSTNVSPEKITTSSNGTDNILTNSVVVTSAVSTNKMPEKLEIPALVLTPTNAVPVAEETYSSNTGSAIVETNTAMTVMREPTVQETTNITEEVVQPQIQTTETAKRQTVLGTGNTVQADLAELLSATEEKKTVPPENKKIPIKERTWFPWALSVFVSTLLMGGVWLGDKYERYMIKKKRSLHSSRPEMASSHVNNEVKKEVDPPVEKKVELPSQEPIKKRTRKIIKEVPVLTNLENDAEAHQKGVRMLANIKTRRMVINRKMKALRTEMEKYHQSESRFLDIVEEMEALREERNQLTRQHRQARILVKGKEGERIKEERRLLAKELRLMKKSNDNDLARIIEVVNKKAVLAAQEKELVKSAEAEAKERMTTADWWHGKRLYQEAVLQEKQLNERIRQLKKETDLKKSEILQLDDEIREGLKIIRMQKSLAVRKMKGHQFANQKRLLSKQIIEANESQDLNKQTQLKEELESLKTKEKEYIQWTKNFDYIEGRRSVVPASVQMRAERRDKANLWKGYRMLRDLDQGLIENGTCREAIKKKARTLIGKQYSDSFNYEIERASALKPATLASIYLNYRKQKLI